QTVTSDRQFRCMGGWSNYNPRLSVWGHGLTNRHSFTPPHVVGRHHLAASDEVADFGRPQLLVSKLAFAPNVSNWLRRAPRFSEVCSWLLRALQKNFPS